VLKTAVAPRALVLLAVLTLVWGTNWVLFPHAVREVSVWTFRAVGVTVAGLALLAWARWRGMPMSIPRVHWLRVGLATLAYMVVWNICSTYAAIMLPTGQSAVLGFTMPLWSALIAWLVLRQSLSGRLVLAVALGSAAVVLLMVPSFASFADAPMGLAMGLLAAVGWAVGTLILKHKPIDVPAAVLTGWQLLLTAVPITFGAFALGDGRWFMPSWKTILIIGYISLVPMGIGNACWFAIVGMLPANVAGLSAVAVPIVAMISGAVVAGEPLGWMQWLAMACTAAALSLAVLKPKAAPAN
jgi:drug/metabolite transporter (DMT)-like permease